MSDRSPSEREFEILNVLWKIGPSSVREVHEYMCPNQELAFNTIQTLLRIMDKKGLVTHKQKKGPVKHRRQGQTFVYTPTYSREKAVSKFLNKVFDGAMDELVLSLVRSKKPTAQELERLQAIIDDSRKKAGKKKRK